MKLQDLLKRITPLPWKSVPGFHQTRGADNDAYATHAANVLPELVQELRWLRDAMVRLDPLLDILSQPGQKMICGQSMQHIESALARAEEVKE